MIFRGDEDRFELRAKVLEMEQRQRFELGGKHLDFFESRYEQMQRFLIERYQKMSKTWEDPLVTDRTEEQTQRFFRIFEGDDPSGYGTSSSDGYSAARAS